MRIRVGDDGEVLEVVPQPPDLTREPMLVRPGNPLRRGPSGPLDGPEPAA
jgi:hypothetical protein